MKKIIVVLLSALFFSGCLNITEEVFLEKDGSGRYITTIDMSKMQEMLEMLKAFSPDAQEGNKSDLSNLDSMQNMMGDLSGIPGISDFRKEKKDSNIYVISFRFKDVKALNAAMSKRNQKDAMGGDKYSFSPGSFTCNDTTMMGLNKAMEELNGEAGSSDSVAMAMQMFQGMMGDMTYRTIYHFPGKVTSYSNKEATLSEDGKTLRLEINLFDKEKTHTFQNKVSFQK